MRLRDGVKTMAEKIKATARQSRATSSGKVFNPNHNTNEQLRATEPHIDASRMVDNFYIEIQAGNVEVKHEGGKGGYFSATTERKRYEELYGDGLEARNARYREKGKKDNERTLSKLFRDIKTAPIEGIYQIGNKNTDISRKELGEKLYIAFQDFFGQIKEKYSGNLIPLDFSLHMDEATPHIHFRYTLGAVDKFGYFMPNQTQALKEMGFDRQDTTKERSRYNNAGVTYSDATREMFYQCCEKLGLVIDREVESPSRRQEEIHLFKFHKMQEDIARLEMEIKENEKRTEQVLIQYQNTHENLTQTQAQLSALYNALENIEQSRKELEKEVFKLTSKKNDAQIDVHNLQINLDKLQEAIGAAQQRYQEAQAQTQAIVEKLAALEQHARDEYDAYDGRSIKKYETIEAKPEKKNLFGKVTQEAAPRMYLVDADQLDRAEQALGHVWINEYNNKKIRDLEKKLTESEAIHELQQQLQAKDVEINKLTGINERQARDIKKQEAEIGNRDIYLTAIGKKQEFEDSVKQSKKQTHKPHL